MEKTTDRLISLESVYNNPTFPAFGRPCDTNLYADDGTEFKVHSELISKHSEFLKSLFSISEEIGQSVVIHGIESDIIKRILYYLYTGHFSLNTKNMLHLLIASDFLIIEPLILECRSFVLKHINEGNCIRIFLTAYRIKGLGMKDECLRFLVLCFEKAVMLSVEEAYNLPYDSVKYLLSSRSINVSHERIIWSYIEEWVKTDASNRMSVVPELLRYLCVNDIDEELASYIITSPIILQNDLYKDLGDHQVTLHHLTDKQKVWEIINHRSKLPFFTGNRLPKSIYFITKCSLENDDVQMFLSYDHHFDLWRRVMSSNFILHTILRVDHRVYIFKDNGYLRRGIEVCIYDLLKKETIPIAPILITRGNCIVLEAAGNIYALESSFSSPEILRQYVYETDEWISLRPMPYPVVPSAALGLNGLIYVTGYDDDMMQTTLLVYNPSLRSLRRWRKTVSPPNTGRFDMVSVVYQGKIFLIGGLYLDDDEPCTDVEVYDPVTDEWVVYPEVPFDCEIPNAGGAVVKEKLFVFRKEEPYSVAYWDGSGEWKLVDDQSPLQNMFLYSFFLIEEENVVRKITKANREVVPSRWKETGLGREMLLKSYD